MELNYRLLCEPLVKNYQNHPSKSIDYNSQRVLKHAMLLNRGFSKPIDYCININETEKIEINELFFPFIFSNNKDLVEEFYDILFSCYIGGQLINSYEKVIPNGRIDCGNIMVCGIAPGYLKSVDNNKYKDLLLSAKPISYLIRVVLLNLFPNRVYFTNLLKMAIVDNEISDRTMSFISEYSTIDREIELMQPKIILALGNDSYNMLSKKHNNVVKIYHPSYVYRKNNFKIDDDCICAYREHIIEKVKELQYDVFNNSAIKF